MATNETVKWLAGLTKRDCYQAILRLTEGYDERRAAMVHAVALARRDACSCINCIRAEYAAAGRPFPEAA